MSAKCVSELMKALLHSVVVCTKRIKLNNGIETTCSTFYGTAFHFHSILWKWSYQWSTVWALKNNTIQNKANIFLKLSCVYEVNLMFCVAEACYPWTGRSELRGFLTPFSLQAPQQLGTAYPVSWCVTGFHSWHKEELQNCVLCC